MASYKAWISAIDLNIILNMLTEGFLLLIKRFIIVPVVSILITRGMISVSPNDQTIQMVCEVFGWIFFIAAYFATHVKKDDPINLNIWTKIKNLCIKTGIAEVPTIVTTQTNPNETTVL